MATAKQVEGIDIEVQHYRTANRVYRAQDVVQMLKMHIIRCAGMDPKRAEVEVEIMDGAYCVRAREDLLAVPEAPTEERDNG